MRGRAEPYDSPSLPFTGSLASTRQTSEDAAAGAEPRSAGLRRLILSYIIASGGATDKQIQYALCLTGDTERPRRIELLKAGLIQDSGETRQTGTGRKAVVWRAVP